MDGRKFLNTEERAYLESSLRSRIDADLRNVSLILFALHSGARANEILEMRWENINLKTGETWIRTLKGGSPRACVLPRFLLFALAKLRENSPEKPFPISYNRLGEIWRNYRTVEKPFHCLRHTFAMFAYSRTKDIRFVQKALGHKSITNTMVYADYSYSASEFKKLMRVR